jgi:hypothetical protein
MKFDITDSEAFKAIIKRSRARELHELTQRLYSGPVIVYGEAGIGKSALLEMFKQENPGAYIKITLLRGYEIELDGSLLLPYTPSERGRPTAFPELLIIDGFDEVLAKPLRERVADIIRESWQRGFKVILSAKKQINEKVFEQHASTIRLLGLAEKDINVLVNIYQHHFEEHPAMIQKLKAMLHGLGGNPRDVLAFLNFIVKAEIKTPVIYQRPELILEPERPEIITDLRLVNQRLLDRIGRRPEEVRELSPRQFEELVAELFIEKGYQVELTQQTRDGGKDLIIMNRSDIGNFMIYAECKHYRPDRPVGVDVVTQLLGRINFDRATAGMVVTSSYFSPDAKNFQSQIEHQMSLIDFVKLSSWIKQRTWQQK